MNQALAFGITATGGVLLIKAVTGSSFSEIVQGHPRPVQNSGIVLNVGSALGSGIGGESGGGLPFVGVSDVSRLDQGIDLTAKGFVSPVAGRVVYSSQSDPGWAGGGYVAVQSSSDPNTVYYWAEGISPTVSEGATVTPGQPVGQPRTNPYNGILGNIEFGRANPASPGQPLAQVISDPASMVENMYHWLLSLGLQAARDTSNAGRA